jgi:MerR family transcriptional regulator, light-induced transcriptional regulator
MIADQHGNYTIKELEALSGIKAHTIRIWEQRYKILSPGRTDTNIRYYNETDLKHLLNISLLNKNGFKISKLANLSDSQIRNMVMDLNENNLEFENQIDALILAMIEFNEASFEKIISTNILRIGFESCIMNIAMPLLQRIGLLWQTTAIRPTHEHFVSNLIRQKIIVAIDGQINFRVNWAKKCLLFLPERELHELSLLFYNFILRSRGNHTLYLGASVPLNDVMAASLDYKPDYIFTLCVSHPPKSQVQEYINKLSAAFPSANIVISGRQVLRNDLMIPNNVIIFETLQESISFINENFNYGLLKSSGRLLDFQNNNNNNDPV